MSEDSTRLHFAFVLTVQHWSWQVLTRYPLALLGTPAPTYLVPKAPLLLVQRLYLSFNCHCKAVPLLLRGTQHAAAGGYLLSCLPIIYQRFSCLPAASPGFEWDRATTPTPQTGQLL